LAKVHFNLRRQVVVILLMQSIHQEPRALRRPDNAEHSSGSRTKINWQSLYWILTIACGNIRTTKCYTIYYINCSAERWLLTILIIKNTML
jgi:hypothetical protein